jgi:hypothetical protein
VLLALAPPYRGRKGGRGSRESAACREEKERRLETDRAEREEEQRRKGKEISQGLVRDFRKLQGPVCKIKFSVDLKSK